MGINHLFSTQLMWEATVNCNTYFDGLFFYAVKTTGIYCRPSCNSKTPIRENVCFFQTALEAEEHGFRPCKRCRPDLKTTHYNPNLRLVEEVQEFIYEYYQLPLTLKDLATHFHMSAYHLERTFKALTGQTPRDLLESVRINKAKEYLLSTNYTNLDICYEVGFQNPASFYHAFKRQTQQTPQQYRQIKRRNICHSILIGGNK